jgi:uncharacterized membrane protein (TIGR02234 family)
VTSGTTGTAAGTAASRATSRRELFVAVALAAAGAALTLAAAGRPWADAVVEQGPLRLAVHPSGRALAPAVPALGLAGLAGAVAVVATRRLGRLLTGTVLALAGVGVAVVALATVTDLDAAVRPAAGKVVGQREAAPVRAGATAWPWLAVAGGVLTAGAGGLAATRGRRWPGMSRRYEASEARGATPAGAGAGATRGHPGQGTRGMWEALDRGDDPTA